MPVSIGVAIITHNGEKHLPFCLPPLLSSPLRPKIVVVNSSSKDQTLPIAHSMGVDTLLVPRPEFNQGTTRERARLSLNTDIVVMLTQDSYLTSPQVLETLIAPLACGDASVSYARQLPRRGAGDFEAIEREFNYPEKGMKRTLKDVKRLGVSAYFCSNSCAAWKSSALDEVGGFPEVLLGEDTLVAARLLQNGHTLAYVADATVWHSHKATFWGAFTRAFDTGFVRRNYPPYFETKEGDRKHGILFAKNMISQLKKRRPLALPSACLLLFTKWLGYQVGRKGRYFPKWVKRHFSSQDYFWK